MSALPTARATEAEYLAYDLANEGRHEFVNGEIIAMAGAGEQHGLVVSNLHGALFAAMGRGPCRAFIADLRVKIDETGLYAYPDVVVVCGERQFTDSNPPSLTNPTVLFEVLSPSTATYDRGAKVAHYRQRPTVTNIVLVDPESATVEHYARVGADEWHLRTQRDGELVLPAIGARIAVSALFET